MDQNKCGCGGTQPPLSAALAPRGWTAGRGRSVLWAPQAGFEPATLRLQRANLRWSRTEQVGPINTGSFSQFKSNSKASAFRIKSPHFRPRVGTLLGTPQHRLRDEALGLAGISSDVLQRYCTLAQTAQELLRRDAVAVNRKKRNLEKIASAGLTKIKSDVLRLAIGCDFN
jgi:hypothetical protein